MLAFDYRLNHRLQVVFEYFHTHCSLEQHSQMVNHPSPMHNRRELNQMAKDIFSGRMLHPDFVISGNQKDLSQLDRLTQMLLMLTQYDEKELQVKAFSVLVRHRGQPEALLSCMSWGTCLIDHRLLVPIPPLILENISNLRVAKKWLAHPACEEKTRAMVLCHQVLKTLNNLLQTAQPGSVQGKQVSHIIVLGNGHTHVNSILGLQCTISKLGHIPRKLTEIIHLSFQFLGMLCYDNPPVQIELLSSMRIYRNHINNPAACFGEFSSSLVRNNGQVCARFDVGIIQQICKHAISSHDPQWLRALRYLCSFNGVCCDRNVHIILVLICFFF